MIRYDNSLYSSLYWFTFKTVLPTEDARLFISSSGHTVGRIWFNLTITHNGDTVFVWSSSILELRKSKQR